MSASRGETGSGMRARGGCSGHRRRCVLRAASVTSARSTTSGAQLVGNARMIPCEKLVYLPFQPTSDGLVCDGVSVHAIAAQVGTPVYIYSAAAIRDAYRSTDDAIAAYPHAIHYALKANSTLAIVRLLKAIGSRADANSGGEVEVSLRAGFAPADIVFTGVGKTTGEHQLAISRGIGTINAESAGELDRI